MDRVCRIGRAALVGCTVLLAACGAGSNSELARVSTDSGGIALGGYDVIAYYQGDARPGLPDYRYDYDGASFLFISAVNREKFARAPEAFMPQYGGHCAFGMSFGALVEPDPEAYTVEDGRLYMNVSPMVRRFWQWFGNAEDADAHWRELLENPAT